ncbi:MAG: stage sporulation protein [Bacillota bacterium]|nr:stage sporulation protein [Bacillota bacterium]MDK2925792.1 stage sporulation protein [Bacillota bacterium]MDK2959921.1 stage sporulation protein [Bacillota bacterium]
MTRSKKVGQQTFMFSRPLPIIGTATVVGKKEGEGPLGEYFDQVVTDPLFGEKSWEKAESKMVRTAIQLAMQKVNLAYGDLDFMFGGDLLNQIIASNFAARDVPVPFYGLFGACSTYTEALSLAGITLDGGFAARVLVTASSHYQTAERQYRFPTELGVQRKPTAQWTVTGAAATIIGEGGSGAALTCTTVGKVVDMGIKDVNDMGSAMAPAAVATIKQHFEDTGRGPDYYDVIATGDLGSLGKALAQEMLAEAGYDLSKNYTDCGVLIFRPDQDVHSGGSGCGCSATVFSGYFYSGLLSGQYSKVLLVSTGALLSPTSYQQGESIPCIAHAVAVEKV